MSKSLLFVTYDFIKDGYPTMPYSIAVLWAAIKSRKELNDVTIEHHSVSLSNYFRDFSGDREKVLEKVKIENQFLIDRYKDIFNHIAIGVNAWSNLYAKDLLERLNNADYTGYKILGGYDVTASSESDLKAEFPNASFYIKGYAEKPLISILNQEFGDNNFQKVIIGHTEVTQIYSPYKLGILNPTKKSYLETKRGCPHNCGFCEWGNFEKGKVVFFEKQMILNDIEFLTKSGVEEINVLDGTFNYSKAGNYSYVDILNDLLTLSKANITLQCRFEDIKDDENSLQFLKLCSTHKERVSLEFGLQTIHEKEMHVIGRNNNLSIIENVIYKLNKSGIKYSVSLIFGIPYQTEESFVNTINWLFQRNCLNICPYPLRIPRNSEIYKCIRDYEVNEDYDDKNVKIVKEANSFGNSAHNDMTRISELLFKLQYEYDTLNPNEPLIFIDYTYSNGKAKISRISSENRLTLNKEFLIKMICSFIPLVKDEHQFTVNEMVDNKASIEELLPYYENSDYIRNLLLQIDQVSSIADRFWRILLKERKNVYLQSKILVKYNEFKEFDNNLLDMLFIIGSWLYKEPLKESYNVKWFISNEGIVVVQKMYGELRVF
jgi:radical SAM superfamily enzyme YgiQ (UPF0313 family)